MNHNTLASAFGFQASLASDSGQVFRQGAEVVYHNWYVQEFSIEIAANAPWDRIFESEWYDSNIPHAELPSGGQGFYDIALIAVIPQTNIPYSKVSSLVFGTGFSESDGTDKFALGMVCMSQVAFKLKGLATFQIYVWKE